MAAQRNKNHGNEVSGESTDIVQDVAILSPITVSAQRNWKINLGGFESCDIQHRVSYDVAADVDLEAVQLQLSEQLDTLQAADLDLAKAQSKEPKSFIHKILSD